MDFVQSLQVKTLTAAPVQPVENPELLTDLICVRHTLSADFEDHLNGETVKDAKFGRIWVARLSVSDSFSLILSTA